MDLVLQVVLMGNVNRRVLVVGRALLGMSSRPLLHIWKNEGEFTANGETDFVLAQRIFNVALVPVVEDAILQV
jgi:hypothetical protein